MTAFIDGYLQKTAFLGLGKEKPKASADAITDEDPDFANSAEAQYISFLDDRLSEIPENEYEPLSKKYGNDLIGIIREYYGDNDADAVQGIWMYKRSLDAAAKAKKKKA